MKTFMISAVFLLIHAVIFAQVRITSLEAKNNVGQIVSICDKVVDVAYLENAITKPTLLNLGGAYPNHLFTISIKYEYRPNFSFKPEEYYLNKQVCVTGKLIDFKGKPQIAVLSPAEIILDEGGRQSTNTTALVPTSLPAIRPDAAPVKAPGGGIVAADTASVVINSINQPKPSDSAKAISVSPPPTTPVSKSTGSIVKIDTTTISADVYDIKLTSAVNVRSGPGAEFEILELLKPGTVVTILRSQNGWSYLSYTKYSEEQSRSLTLRGFAKNSLLK